MQSENFMKRESQVKDNEKAKSSGLHIKHRYLNNRNM